MSLQRNDKNSTTINRTQAPKNIIAVPAGVEQYGKIHTPQYNDQCQGCRQIDPDILNAFKQIGEKSVLNSNLIYLIDASDQFKYFDQESNHAESLYSYDEFLSKNERKLNLKIDVMLGGRRGLEVKRAPGHQGVRGSNPA